MIDDVFRCKKSMDDDDARLLVMAAERMPYFNQGRLLTGWQTDEIPGLSLEDYDEMAGVELG